MKVAEFKISGLMTVAIVVGMVAATFAITSQVTGEPLAAGPNQRRVRA